MPKVEIVFYGLERQNGVRIALQPASQPIRPQNRITQRKESISTEAALDCGLQQTHVRIIALYFLPS